MAVRAHSGSQALKGAGTRKAAITEADPSSWMRGRVPAKVFGLARSRPPILHLRNKEGDVSEIAHY